jgi:predicted kinase
MAKVIMGIGMPGSGKTTLLKSFAEKRGYTYVSADEIREEALGDSEIQSHQDTVWGEVRSRVYYALQEGANIVVDATFSKGYERREFITFCRNSGAKKVQGAFMVTPLEITRERNASRERVVPEHALERMYRDLSNEKPVVEDGFDSVFDFDEFEKIDRAERKVVQVKRFDGPKMR